MARDARGHLGGLLSFAGLLMALFYARAALAQDPPPPPPPPVASYATVYDYIASNANLSDVKAIIDASSLTYFKNSSSGITVFLPTNDAFDQLAKTLGADVTFAQMMSQYNVTLAKGLQYQTLPYAFNISSLEIAAAGSPNQTGYVSTMLTTPYTKAYTMLGVVLQLPSATTILATGGISASFVEKDIAAGSSYVNVVDTYLPFWFATLDAALQIPEISTMYQALKDTNTLQQITNSTAAVQTLFAPENVAFRNAQVSYQYEFNKNTNTLLYQVVPQGISLLDTNISQKGYPTLDGAPVGVTSQFNPANTSQFSATIASFIPGNPVANVLTASIPVGMQPTFYIHIIDQVLIPTYTTVWQVINYTSGYGTLKVEYMLNNDVISTLKNPASRITLFGANNEAFATMVARGLSLSTADNRQRVLKNLVAKSSQSFDSLKAGVTMDTLQGPRALLSSWTTDRITITATMNFATVISPSNSVLFGRSYVHTVDSVLVPQLADGSSAVTVPSLVLVVFAALAGRLLTAQL